MAEGARLESVYAGNRIAGSNPALSAILRRSPSGELWWIAYSDQNPQGSVEQGAQAKYQTCFDYLTSTLWKRR